MAGQRSHGSRVVLAAAVAALALVAAACSSSAGAGGGNAASSGGDGGSSTITIMSWNSLANPVVALPEAETAIDARVKALNASGGINGHHINLIFCDSNFDPNAEAACAREAVTKKVAAVVGAESFFPGTAAVLEQAKIPLVGARGADPTDFTSPISFPLVGGTFSWGTGMAALAAQLHLRSVAIVSSAASTSAEQSVLASARLKKFGVNVLRTIAAPANAPDQSSTASAASAGADGIIVDSPPGDSLKVLQALSLTGYKGVVITPSASLTPDYLKALGHNLSFRQYAVSLIVPATETSNSTVAQFVSEMRAEDKSKPADETALTVWTAMTLFANVAAKLSVVNASTVLAAMNALKPAVALGTVPPYAVAGVRSPVADAPRLFSPDVMYVQVKDGVQTPLTGKFVNPFSP